MDNNRPCSSRTSATGTQEHGIRSDTSKAMTPSVTAPSEVSTSSPPRGDTIPPHVVSGSHPLSDQSHDVTHIGSWVLDEGQFDITRPEGIPQSIIAASPKLEGPSSAHEGHFRAYHTSPVGEEGDAQKKAQAVELLELSLHRPQ